MSQDEVKTRVPTGLKRLPQSAGSAVTLTATDACACASAGLARSVIILKIGKVAKAAIRQPASMIGLRPILSDSQPNTTKKPQVRTSAYPTSRFVV